MLKQILEARSFRTVLILLAVSLIYILFQLKNLIVDGDTFWAIKVGEWISENNAVPTCDTFSWTVKGNPWVAHEWLYDLLIYKLYTAIGYLGIVFLIFFVFSIMCYVLWRLYNSEENNLVQKLLVFTIVLLLMKGFIVARPQVFSYTFFMYFLLVLIYKRKLLWTLPLVTILWTNMHGSVVLGVAMLILQVVYEFFINYIMEKKFYVDKRLLAMTLIVPLFSFLNPYFIDIWKTAFWLITSNINHQIQEWRPPDFTNIGILVIYLLIIILTPVICYNKRSSYDNKRPLLAIYLTVNFFLALISIRYYPYLVICWGIFILNLLHENIYSKKVWIKRISFLFLALTIIICFSILKDFPISIENTVDQKIWPVEATKHLEQRRTLNEYMWGGYLIFKGIPVFIDGRADVYQRNSEVFVDYIDMLHFKKDPIVILDKYQVEQIIIPVNTPLDIYLTRTGCPEKYRDETAVIFVRK